MRFLQLLVDLNIPEQLIGNKNRIKDLRNYKSRDRSVQDEQKALPQEENVLEDFQRQWRTLSPKQTLKNLKKSKRNLRTKPYSKKAKHDWKTI